MTRPAYVTEDRGETVKVRELPSGSRIVSSSAGWVVRVDWPIGGISKSSKAIIYARKILRWRMAGKTLRWPWGRVLKYPDRSLAR